MRSNCILKVSAVGGMVASGGGDKLTIAVGATLGEKKNERLFTKITKLIQNCCFVMKDWCI